ncbi:MULTISPECIES: RNA polymerase sigma factor [Bizionia]|uniref:RNA polymerase sigma factor n=1 Tax=Bizionia algoritergicola TaxID=291187 RepID=A0A5D0QRS1_9FLAO|nr:MULTISPECIES: RNA polymerase sigma factor [Bizionia]OBX23211.1 RNA polymerase subunit sigma-70 [Bizionia sp. APA-3]TYB71585.1 RNA polymerase sigma factor [Bizionia algoritergicola]
MFQLEIIEKCKANNRQAQMQLYNQYCQGMYIVARRFVKHDAEAEDIVQDAFIKAFSKLDQYQAEVTFGAWLKRIVINTSIDMLKAQKHQLVELETVHLNVVDSGNDNWLVEDTVEVVDIKEAISSLADKYRLVLTLYLLEGYDHQEISDILNITEVSSRTQLYRGKVQLQELLKQKNNGTGY